MIRNDRDPFKYNMPGYKEIMGDEELLADAISQLTRGDFPALNMLAEMLVHGELFDQQWRFQREQAKDEDKPLWANW